MSKHIFRVTTSVHWKDLDANLHMSNSAYLAHTVESRLSFLTSHGYDAAAFKSDGLGLAALEEKIKYFREICWSEKFHIDLYQAHPNPSDGVIHFFNIFRREGNAKPFATIDSKIVWLNLATRKRATAPQQAVTALKTLPPPPTEFTQVD